MGKKPGSLSPAMCDTTTRTWRTAVVVDKMCFVRSAFERAVKGGILFFMLLSPPMYVRCTMRPPHNCSSLDANSTLFRG